MLEKLILYRRDLHQIPELGFDLEKTHAYVKEKLESFGYQPKIYAKTGLVAYKEGKEKSSIGFRADMDALPIHEETNVSFKSRHDGKMHACGHDGHTAVLLAFAEYVSKLPQLKKSITFIFQPAEEGPGGAKVMIDEGALQDFQVEMIFGLHVFPGLSEGQVGLRKGPLLARNAEFDIEIFGKAAHGAMPHLGKDAILASSHLISNLNHLVSREVNPNESVVVTIGTIHGGDARNIIANHVKVTGTIRAFDDQVFDHTKQRINDVCEGLSLSLGVKIKPMITDYYPAVDNDPKLYELVKKALPKESVVVVDKYMFSEDFAFYQKVIPGFFAFIGSKNEEKGYTYPLHSNRFNFDEKILLDGLNYYQSVLKELQTV